MNFIYKMYAFLFRKNHANTPKEVIVNQMTEPRPLPIGKTQFEEWSSRIISGALVEVDVDSQKFTLAQSLLHLGPTESHKPDAFFIHSLRKLAINQTAIDMSQEIKKKVDERNAAAADLAEKKNEPATV